MRTIKFRGWSYEKNGWVYGDLRCASLRGGAIIVDENDGYRWVVDAKSVGQYTGFTTKTAGDIYEGDLLNSDDENLELVMWDEESGQWCVVAPYDYSIENALEDEVANAELVVVGTEYEAEYLGRAPWKDEADAARMDKAIHKAREIFKAYGFEVVERIALKNIRTGKIYR